jgi:hypothetical protein
MSHEEICQRIFEEACRCLRMKKGFTFLPKTVRKGDGEAKAYTLGYTDLKSKLVVIDIYTRKLKKQKKYSSILAVMAHELAHHQKKPYRQYDRRRKRWINRIHYPEFYEQVNKNIAKFKKDKVLKQFYVK